MPTSFARASARAIAVAFEGDTAIPSTRRVIRSSTTWIWSASVCSLGPTYRHSTPSSSAAAALQPSRAKSKKGLFIAFGTRAKV